MYDIWATSLNKQTFISFMNSVNNEYGMSVEIACNLDKIKQEFEEAIANARAKVDESEMNKRNVVYKAKYIEIEQPTNAEIYVVHIT